MIRKKHMEFFFVLSFTYDTPDGKHGRVNADGNVKLGRNAQAGEIYDFAMQQIRDKVEYPIVQDSIVVHTFTVLPAKAKRIYR